MLSNKMTFSLTCLVMLLAVGLVFAPSVMADGDKKKTHFDLKVEIGAAESMVDVSAEAGMQIASGRTRADRQLDLDGDGTKESAIADDGTVTGADDDDVITLSVKFSHPVNLYNPGASLQDVEEATQNRDDRTKPLAVKDSGGNFGPDDIYAAAFDVDGRQLGVLPLEDTSTTITADFIDATSPGRNFLVSIHQTNLVNAYSSAFEISKLVFFIPKASGAPDPGDNADASIARGIRKADLSHVTAHFGPEAHQHVNDKSNEYQIDLVDADQGNPMYYDGVSATQITAATVAGAADGSATAYNGPGSGTPGVVTIDQLQARAGFIETGPFDVRIILTEAPKGGLTTDMVLVEGGGAATAVTEGVSLKGALPADDAITNIISAQSARDSGLTTNIATYYVSSADPVAANSTPAMATAAQLPEATGRDNMYHQYFVTITPDPGVNGPLTISLKQFEDNVIPSSNRYVPLTSQQRIATQLTGIPEVVRDIRVMNETLMVQVNSAGDAKIAAAKAAYDARQKVLDAVANEAVLGNKLVVPAGGYLVIHAADLGNTGIVDPKSKVKDKVSAASKLYNTTKLGLPFPANNLDTFFRNGGTLNLAYADIPAATGSGHGDSKEVAAVGHDDDTGYRGATTNAYTVDALIINEIMWGLDGDSADSQYIELYNPGTAAIGIDNKEWVLSVGAPPTGYTLISSVSNNPASGYWAPLGQGGLTQSVRTAKDEAGDTTAIAVVAVTDLISMSRITGATDDSAAASWAVSTRPSANLQGRRIGTPGAANSYAKPAAPAPEPEPTPPAKASVATAADLMISEIMVASSAGRLPQWIEITNTSVGEVSLDGWMVGIDNDSADAAVVASSLSIKLDGVTLGAGQSALVVSKTSNRNSGVAARSKGDANAGALDSNRIVDASSQIKPASMTYSMLSEMSFRVSLEPPLPLAGGVTVRGDVVGNLGGGWELPMSEAGRSSIIRREMGKAAEIMGTDAAGWTLASDTGLGGAYVATYYGDKDDMGTPGYDAGGALPVELSKFGAKRDPLTGQVIVTWETQSELNNAGFFIKRSQQKNSKFVVVNPTMIPGAGTVSEKRSYTYTDTTAQPNIVYYYQIEDVSLDGQRQTLTRAHRLKGHVGAAGKLTTIWGELKEQE